MPDKPQQDYGSGPIQEQFREKMIAIMHLLDDVFNGEGTAPEDRKVGIVLLTFPLGDPIAGSLEHRVNYISNGVSREDMVKLMREQANRFDTSTQ